jgi:hypothetical protein
VTNTDTDAGAALPEVGPIRDWKRFALVLLSLAVLIAGVVVFVLGKNSASGASDDLRAARAELTRQQGLARKASRCLTRTEKHQPTITELARNLFTTAEEIVRQDEAIVAAQRDLQAAGVAHDIDAYNNAIDRHVASIETANQLLSQRKLLHEALSRESGRLRFVC